jgi:hypothetical protein
MTPELLEISEWYSFLIKLILRIPENHFLTIYNGFISKTDKNNNQVINHISGLKMLKKDEILKVSKD